MSSTNSANYSEVHQFIDFASPTNSLQVVGEFTEGIHVYSAIYYNPPMQRLIQATNDIVMWENDIHSFQKVMAISKGKPNLWLLLTAKNIFHKKSI